MTPAVPSLPSHWRHSRRGVSTWMAVVLVAAVAAAGVIGVVAYTFAPDLARCPLQTSESVQSVTSGARANTSYPAPTYPNGTVLFAATAHSCHPPYTIVWNLGPGTQSMTKVHGAGGNYSEWVVHVYPGPGFYPGSVAFRDAAGQSGETTYYCADATHWPVVNVDSGDPQPACP